MARVLTSTRKYDHITPILQSLHWLPIKFCISYKILLLAYKALNDLAPAYLTNLLSRYNPTRSLRSQNSGLLVVPRIAKSTKGGRTFSYLAPKLWNSLPDNAYYAYLEHCWSCYGNVIIWQCRLLRRKIKATIDTYSGPTDRLIFSIFSLPLGV